MFPSEDELLELLRLEIIDVDEYELLLEASLQGVDSTNQYLLDDIPDLALYLRDLRDLSAIDISTNYTSAIQSFRPGAGFVRHQYSHEGATDGRSRYRNTIRLNPTDEWDGELRLYREFSGRERIARRFMRYRPSNSALRLVELGNFSTRFGLGSALGYRGKLLTYSQDVNGESALYPDYGGMNGAHVALRQGNWTADAVISSNRDDEHHIRTSGLQITRQFNRSHISLIAANTQVRNRASNRSLDDFKLSGSAAYIYSRSKFEAEITWQAAENPGPAAVILEGRHRQADRTLRYAIWAYGDSYIDLAGGSKSGSISRKACLAEVDFDYSTRRAGQEGGQIETSIGLLESVALVNQVRYSQIDRDSSNLELLSSLESGLSSTFELRAVVLLKRRYLLKPANNDERVQRQYRAEARLSLGDWRLRTYIAYREHNQQWDYGGFFVNAAYRSATTGRWEGWLDMRRINLDTRQLDYAYVYIVTEQAMGEKIATAFKIAHRYSRSSGDSHETTITLELRAGI